MKAKAVLCAAVVCLPVAARCSKAKEKPGRAPAVVWGEAVKGVQLSLRADRTACRAGESVRLKFVLRLAPRSPRVRVTDHPDLLTVAIDGPTGQSEEVIYRWDPAALPTRDWPRLRGGGGVALPEPEHVVKVAAGGGKSTVSFSAAGKYRLQATYAFDGKLVNPKRLWHPVAWEGGSVRSNVVTINVRGRAAAARLVAEDAVAWGKAANGLQAGLEIKGRRFEAGEPIDVAFHLRNVGEKWLRLLDVDTASSWRVVFIPEGGGTPTRAFKLVNTRRRMVITPFAPGKEKVAVREQIGSAGWQFAPPEAAGLGWRKAAWSKTIRPGRYTLTVSYGLTEHIRKYNVRAWPGIVTTAPVEIEITEKD